VQERVQQVAGPRHTTFQSLPLHLQHLVLAAAAAPLTTCKASAANAGDSSLTCTWLLEKEGTQFASFQEAADYSLWDVCVQLVRHEQPGMYGLTRMLALSAECGRADVMAALLEWCCKQRCQQHCVTCDALGDALRSAAICNRLSVMELLVRHPSVTSQHVRWAVVYAILHGHHRCIEFLLTSRPDAASLELQGCPVTAAAMHGRVEALQLLAQHGVQRREAALWSD
jgi:hypothetical protein